MDRTPRIGIFTERQVGIGSAAGALEPYLRWRPDVAWFDVTYAEPGGRIERLPLPRKLLGPWRGFAQTGRGLRRGPYRSLLFLTHNPAVLRQHAIARTPTLLWTDVTPALLDQQAEHYGHAVDRFRAVRQLKRALVRRTFQRAALCVGWSNWARRSFVADYGVAESRTRVIAPGVDLSHWSGPGARSRTGPMRLLFVGGDFVRKGGDLLLEVFGSDLRGRCELDLVTRDPIAAEPGVRVHRTLGPRSAELRALYRDADALVLPARGDCFSIAALEAMAMALPVVITAVGGIPDIVEPGRSGHLIAPGDGRALREALDALIADPDTARALGRRGRELVEERFDAEKVASRLLSMLGDIGR